MVDNLAVDEALLIGLTIAGAVLRTCLGVVTTFADTTNIFRIEEQAFVTAMIADMVCNDASFALAYDADRITAKHESTKACVGVTPAFAVVEVMVGGVGELGDEFSYR